MRVKVTETLFSILGTTETDPSIERPFILHDLPKLAKSE